MSNVFQNIQLERIADAIQGGGSSVTVNIDVTGAGDMQGATASAAGAHGLVPAPAAGDEGKVLSGAGTWIDAGGGELGDLEDVTITSPTSGESLKYDGTKWVNGNVTAELPDFIEETAGSIVTVEAAERPTKSLKVAINPVQSGSGDPSPENIRPISGWTEVTVTANGKNLVNVADTTISSQTTLFSGIKLNAGTYALSANAVNNGTVTGRFRVQKTGASNIFLNIDIPAGTNGQVKGSFTLSNDTTVSLIGAGASAGYAFSLSNVQLESGDTATSYEPYNGTTYSIPFPSEAGTVYGGTLDVTSGTLTVTKANIASYDGETLPGAWISDRDAYAEGTTPTTGAQVVYDLDTPITYQLTPTEVQMLLGTNNIWADTGEITELKYIPQEYNDLLEEVGDGVLTRQIVQTGEKWDGNNVMCCVINASGMSNGSATNFQLETFGITPPAIQGVRRIELLHHVNDYWANCSGVFWDNSSKYFRGNLSSPLNGSGTLYIFFYFY